MAMLSAFTLDDYKWSAEQFNKVGEQVKKDGLQLGYHNHNFEFKKFEGGVTGYDEFLRLTDPDLVKLEMDCGWVTVAGHDPVAYLHKFPDRYKLLHIKDFKKGFTPTSQLGETGQGAPVPTELGRAASNTAGSLKQPGRRILTTFLSSKNPLRKCPRSKRSKWIPSIYTTCMFKTVLSGALGCVVLLAQADQVGRQQKKPASTPAISLTGAPPVDQAAADRGKQIFVPACGFCHGPDARGKSGPDLLRSTLVRDDHGSQIGPVIHAGRPDRGMRLSPDNE